GDSSNRALGPGRARLARAAAPSPSNGRRRRTSGRAGGDSRLRARLVVLVLEQELLEIQVALNPAHHGIVDRAAIAEPQELAPLDSYELTREAPVRGRPGLHDSVHRAIRPPPAP